VIAGPRNHRNRTPHIDDRDHSKGVIDDALMLKRDLKQRRDKVLRCTQDWKSSAPRAGLVSGTGASGLSTVGSPTDPAPLLPS